MIQPYHLGLITGVILGVLAAAALLALAMTVEDAPAAPISVMVREA